MYNKEEKEKEKYKEQTIGLDKLKRESLETDRNEENILKRERNRSVRGVVLATASQTQATDKKKR